MLDLLKKTLLEAPVVSRGSYEYFIHPITDGVPSIHPDLLLEIVHHILGIVEDRVDKIVTIEAMGIPIGAALSVSIGVPLSIIRKRQYWLPGEVAIHQTTGYSKGELFMNGIDKGDRVLVVDDVVSTGGTLISVLEALGRAGAEVIDTIVVIERGDGAQMVREAGHPLHTLIRINVKDGKVHIVDGS